MIRKKYLIVVAGPTAVGKTELTIDLAKHFQSEIISSDSRQFYREMNIGTAKPTEEELAQVKHHFIDDLSIHDAYSVGDFERDGLKLLDELFQTMDLVFLTGGSGLYIKALCEGLDKFPDVPDAILQHYKSIFATQGIEALQKELEKVDPDYYQRVDLQNPHRLIRALSVSKASGKSFSSFHQQEKAARSFTPIFICLHREREQLYERINRRVNIMVKQGLIEEAQELYPFRHLNSLQTVGYQELFEFMNKKISRAEAIELIKRNTRRYAKRQGTWFRKEEYWNFFKPEEKEKIINFIEDKIQPKRLG